MGDAESGPTHARKSRYFCVPASPKKKVRFSRAEVGSLEELSDDLGRFGHPKHIF